MKQRDEILFVEDILIFCRHIKSYVSGVDRTEFLANQMLQDALVRKIEIIGEAVKNISKETQSKFPEVAWSDIAKMRDKVIHHYYRVDLDAVWESATRDIPVLEPQIEKVLKSIEEKSAH